MARHSKILFNEIFYRYERNQLIKKCKEGKMTYIALIMIGIIGLSGLSFVHIYLRGGKVTDNIFILGICIDLTYIGFFVASFYTFLTSYCQWITIIKEGIIIIATSGKKTLLLPNLTKKVVINIRKKCLCIYYNDRKIILKRDRDILNNRFLSHDQFERFKKAMKEIGVEYEIVYA